MSAVSVRWRPLVRCRTSPKSVASPHVSTCSMWPVHIASYLYVLRMLTGKWFSRSTRQIKSTRYIWPYSGTILAACDSARPVSVPLQLSTEYKAIPPDLWRNSIVFRVPSALIRSYLKHVSYKAISGDADHTLCQTTAVQGRLLPARPHGVSEERKARQGENPNDYHTENCHPKQRLP